MTKENEKPLDPVAQFILETLQHRVSATPIEIARALGEQRRRPIEKKADAWRRFLNPVKQQMVFLARLGEIEITRKGELLDPENFRGVVKMRLKQSH